MNNKLKSCLVSIVTTLAITHSARSDIFNLTGSSIEGGQNRSSVVLADGRVLVAGGYAASASASAEVYDPVTKTWTPTDPMGTAREDFTMTLLPNGKVLVTGGHQTDAWTVFNTTEIWDPATGHWTPGAPMSVARKKHKAVVLPTSGLVLVQGGYNFNDGVLNTAELYSVANKWKPTGSMQVGRFEHTLTVLANGKVLAAGGVDENGDTPAAEIYDPATRIWTATGSLNAARREHTATLLSNGKVLVTGGMVFPGSYSFSCELFDPVTGLWSHTGDMSEARGLHHRATRLPDGKVLVTGGYNAFVVLSSTEIYDPATELWRAGAPMNVERCEHIAELLTDQTVLVSSGTDGIVDLLASELYTFGPTITTVVGNHASGGTYTGDNGPALDAGLSGPLGLTFYNGDLLIADTYNGAVRLATGGGGPNSTISSILPTENAWPWPVSPVGLVVDENGYLYVADADSGAILKFTDWTQAPDLLGVRPALGLARNVASGDLDFITAYNNYGDGNTVGTMDTSGNNYSIVAGTGLQGYSGDGGPAINAKLYVESFTYLPGGHGTVTSGLTVDGSGNIYIADMGNNVVRKVSGGIITTVAGNYFLGGGFSGDNGPAVNAKLLRPTAVAVDAHGNLFIADSGNNRVRRVDHTTGIITTVTGNGPAAYTGDGGRAKYATLNCPGGLAFDASGNLYISDTGNDVIRKVTFGNW